MIIMITDWEPFTRLRPRSVPDHNHDAWGPAYYKTFGPPPYFHPGAAVVDLEAPVRYLAIHKASPVSAVRVKTVSGEFVPLYRGGFLDLGAPLIQIVVDREDQTSGPVMLEAILETSTNLHAAAPLSQAPRTHDHPHDRIWSIDVGYDTVLPPNQMQSGVDACQWGIDLRDLTYPLRIRVMPYPAVGAPGPLHYELAYLREIPADWIGAPYGEVLMIEQDLIVAATIKVPSPNDGDRHYLTAPWGDFLGFRAYPEDAWDVDAVAHVVLFVTEGTDPNIQNN